MERPVNGTNTSPSSRCLLVNCCHPWCISIREEGWKCHNERVQSEFFYQPKLTKSMYILYQTDHKIIGFTYKLSVYQLISITCTFRGIFPVNTSLRISFRHFRSCTGSHAQSANHKRVSSISVFAAGPAAYWVLGNQCMIQNDGTRSGEKCRLEKYVCTLMLSILTGILVIYLWSLLCCGPFGIKYTFGWYFLAGKKNSLCTRSLWHFQPSSLMEIHPMTAIHHASKHPLLDMVK